jgi:hypothetical protein
LATLGLLSTGLSSVCGNDRLAAARLCRKCSTCFPCASQSIHPTCTSRPRARRYSTSRSNVSRCSHVIAHTHARLVRTDRPSSCDALHSRKRAQSRRPFAFVRLRRQRADGTLELTGRAVRAQSAWSAANGLQTPRQTFCLDSAFADRNQREGR